MKVFFIILVLLAWNITSEASQLSVVTYNVWFDSASSEQRLPELLNTVAEKKADIIAFQEVESWFVSALEKDERFKQYKFVVEKGWFDSVKGGLLILSKRKIIQQNYLELPSYMSRGLLYFVTNIEGVKHCFATVHLESMLEDTEIRINQLKFIFGQLSQCNNTVLLGDFNFGDGELENKEITTDFIDIWKQLKPQQNGYTWDINQSDLARRNSLPLEKSRRLDRVYVQSKVLKPYLIELIAKLLGYRYHREFLRHQSRFVWWQICQYCYWEIR